MRGLRRVLDQASLDAVAVEPALLACKCDLCRDRPEGPACVAACPKPALVLINPVKLKKRRNVEAAQALAGARVGGEVS